MRAKARWLWMLSSLAAATLNQAIRASRPSASAAPRAMSSTKTGLSWAAMVTCRSSGRFSTGNTGHDPAASATSMRSSAQTAAGLAFLVAGLHADGDGRALVVGPVVADRLAARADTGHRHPHAHHHPGPRSGGFAREEALVFQERGCAGDRRAAAQEEGEGQLQPGAGGAQP